MNGARFRLVLAALGFAGWIGYLAYLAITAGTLPVTRHQPVILSRAQFLVSTLDAIADLKAEGDQPAATVTIKTIHWSLSEPPSVAPGETITVANLTHCSGWQGPGEYILPLIRAEGGEFQVAQTPLSPGFRSSDDSYLRIYPLTPQTRDQLRTMSKPDRAP